MSARQHFILQGVRRLEVEEYLKQELKGAGFGWVDIRKTPLGTRIIIHASRPGVVIGRRGSTVRHITAILEEDFGLENPQIEVKEISDPTLNAQVMALRLSSGLQKGIKYRRAGYGSLRRIKESGALGAEIVVSGKLTSQRSRSQKFRFGTIAKTGKPSEKFVDKATTQVIMKSGVIGVQVKIMNQTDALPDKVTIPERLDKPDTTQVLVKEKTEETAEVESSEPTLLPTETQEIPPSDISKPETPEVKETGEPQEPEAVPAAVDEPAIPVEEPAAPAAEPAPEPAAPAAEPAPEPVTVDEPAVPDKKSTSKKDKGEK